MINQSTAGRNAPAANRQQEIRRQKRRQLLSVIMMVFAGMILLAATQTFFYYQYFDPQVNRLNGQFAAFMQERTTLTMQTRVQDQFLELIESLQPEESHARLVLEQFELLLKLFGQTPLQITQEVHAALLNLGEQFRKGGETAARPLLTQASSDLVVLADAINELREIYTIGFDSLQGSLESPPWYLWPASILLRDRAGYLAAVTYNRAMYLSRIGEIGTARVLLTGLHASSRDDKMKGLVYYGLGRLQWELFVNANKPENYFQALKYMRQSVQTDPEAGLPKRVLDFMLSLDQGDAAPQAEDGDPSTPSEGEAAAIPESMPLF